MSVVECVQSVLNVSCGMCLNLNCYKSAPQMFGCYNFFPWEYTLETECEILLVNINKQYMQWGVRPCKFVPIITRMKETS